MKSKLHFFILTANALVLGLCLPSAKADVLLGTAPFPSSFNSSTQDFNRAQFSVTDGVFTTPVTIFGNTPALSGSADPISFTLLPGDAGFNAFAALLTNGTNNTFRLDIALTNSAQTDSGGTFAQNGETEEFGLVAPQIDFAGFVLSRIVLNVNSLDFTANAGGGTLSTFNANVQVFTAVPEPGTFLTGFAVMTMAGFCRTRRSKVA